MFNLVRIDRASKNIFAQSLDVSGSSLVKSDAAKAVLLLTYRHLIICYSGGMSSGLFRNQLEQIYMLEFHPSLCMASRIPAALQHVLQVRVVVRVCVYQYVCTTLYSSK